MTPSATLATLADDLAAHRDTILATWSQAARHDPGLTTPATLSRSQFFDHIPAMLDALERKLRATALRESLEARQDEIDNAGGHGLQRWQQGYQESEVMREWISLNACLADELSTFSVAHPEASPAGMSTAWRMVSEFTVAGMSESVAQYTRLQRTEAAGRVQALEEALARVNELERERAALWREATHDLRGNLGLVKNVTQVLQQTLPRADAPADPLRMLERGVGALHALLDDLTIQARLDAGQERREVLPFDAAVLLDELCTAARMTAEERDLFLRTEGPPTLFVEGDAVKVRRIAQNLLHNAVGYTRKGGVEVSWDVVEEPPRRWTLCVRDTGPGLASAANAPLSVAIEAATRDTLAIEADARAQGDTAADTTAAPTLPSMSRLTGHGEGVGLSIVKRLCELLDASVELSTAPGKGTTFRVTFPIRYPKG